jgi:hypothetical protein
MGVILATLGKARMFPPGAGVLIWVSSCEEALAGAGALISVDALMRAASCDTYGGPHRLLT